MPRKKIETKIESENIITNAKIEKLIIKNYRCIGENPIEIEIDDIVVLVGPNNVGKSSILQAYKLIMSDGSLESKISIDDFHNKDKNLKPIIELHTICYDNFPGSEWCEKHEETSVRIKERWTWDEPDSKPKRQGFDFEKSEWSDRVPWGAPNIANSYKPKPEYIDAFASPNVQAESIKNLLKKILDEQIKKMKNIKDDGTHDENYEQLLSSIKELQNKIVEQSQDNINVLNNKLSEFIAAIFPNYKIKYDPKPESDIEKTINFFKADTQLLMGEADKHFCPIENQGSGARRTLLWAALKYIAESTNSSTKSHVLLLDEPEICLHPNAIRDAAKVLYSLPQSSNWQVMTTTHAPIFIDFSRDNTCFIRVEKTDDTFITKTFRPKNAQLSLDDKENLKLLNICDPYMAEFLFSGKTIVIEGDTEYTAFNYIIKNNQDKYKDIHFIRARGKATIVSLIKILNQFGAEYSVLHDTDTHKTNDGRTNPAWSINNNILEEVKKSTNSVRLIASIYNFEEAYLESRVTKEKPYNALKLIMSDIPKYNKIQALLDSLINREQVIPEGAIEWSAMEDLDKVVLS